MGRVSFRGAEVSFPNIFPLLAQTSSGLPEYYLIFLPENGYFRNSRGGGGGGYSLWLQYLLGYEMCSEVQRSCGMFHIHHVITISVRDGAEMFFLIFLSPRWSVSSLEASISRCLCNFLFHCMARAFASCTSLSDPDWPSSWDCKP